jgi:hypothetical protein
MKRIFQILLLLLPVWCPSQQRAIDSLQRLLATATTDSARYQLTSNIAYNYGTTDYDSALYFTNKSWLLAQKNGMKLNEASALASKGYIVSFTKTYRILPDVNSCIAHSRGPAKRRQLLEHQQSKSKK